MGHYDEFYEEEERKEQANRARLQKIRIEGIKDTLHDKIDNFDDGELEFAKELLTNLDSYKGFFTILDRSRK